MRAMGSLEFMRWCVFLDEEETASPNRIESYLALIATEVRRSYIKDPTRVRLVDMFLKFVRGNEPTQRMTQEEYTQNSKNYWLGLVKGIGAVVHRPPKFGKK